VEGSIQSWRDLPSQNWAEMMDFWHCHKPSVPKKQTANGSHNTYLEEKGYGANTGFVARRGVGFVDLTYFLVSTEDCLGVKVCRESFFCYMSPKSLMGIKKEALPAFAFSG